MSKPFFQIELDIVKAGGQADIWKRGQFDGQMGAHAY